MPVLPVRAGAHPSCENRMDSHCTDRRGAQRGTAFPLARGFQRRAAPSLAHDFPTESLVCYTFASGCRREGADCGICNLGRWAAGRHFSAAVGQADFCTTMDEIRICTAGKIRLTGKGSKGISTPVPPQRQRPR